MPIDRARLWWAAPCCRTLSSCNASLLLCVLAWTTTGVLPSAGDAAEPAADEQTRRVVFIAGPPSHGYGAHEHYAGCRLLADHLAAIPNFETEVYKHKWPEDPAALEDADAIVIYSDGGGGHVALPHLDQLRQLTQQGVGIVCIHYAVEVPEGPPGDAFLYLIGGYFETFWSVNPHWTAEYDQLPEHPITRGVDPFDVHDEWYYHMRFRPEMQAVTPILTDVPPPETLNRRDGSHSGNPHVREELGQPQHMAWAVERADGGRGFGFTGGHFHWNWGNEDFRKLVLNAIVWCARAEVPEEGVATKPVTLEDLEANQDYPQPRNFDREEIRRRIGLPADSSARQSEAREPADQAKPDDQSGPERRRRRARRAAQEESRRAAQERPAEPPADVRDPAQAVAGLAVAPDLEATLVTSEPTVRSLTNLDIDHRGRIWVCEVMNYRRHAGSRPEGDRILILEDQDGDGRAEHHKVYYQGPDVDSAMGICILGNRVIVSASPNVLIFTDDNGDDKPDRKEVLFTKTGQPQHDHSAHSFLFGPDGKLYWNFGNTGHGVHDRQGNPVTDKAGNLVLDSGKAYYGGMVFRCNLDGSDLEVLGHNFRNNYEVTVDSFGTLWQSDNDDDGNRGVRINYVMEFGNYGYLDELTGAGWREPRTGMHDEIPLRHWHLNDPGVVPNLLQTGAGSPSGITVYEGELLPEVFRGEVIHCDPGPNVVRAYPVQKDGAGYRADVVNILTGERDNWFRPADVCVAPDGSLFITDWYDPGVGGHAQGDLDRGRIFRVAPQDQPYRVPKFDFETPEGAAAALQNSNLAVRYLAWTALNEMGAAAEPVLKMMLAEHDDPRQQARALWLLGKQPGGGGQAYVQEALQHDNPDLRIVAVRLARQLDMDLGQVVAQLVDDPSPQVRRDCLIALRESRSPQMPELWAQLASHYEGHDRWYLEALGIAAHQRWDVCLAAWLERVGDDWNTPAGRDIVWRSRAAQTPQYLAEIIQNPAVPVEELPRYFRAFDFQEGPAKPTALRALIELSADEDTPRTQLVAYESLMRVPADSVDSPERREALNRVLDRLAGSGRFVELVTKFAVSDRYPDLLTIAQQHADEQLGVEAIRALLEKEQWAPIASALRSATLEEALATARVLGNSADGCAANLLLDVVQDAKLDQELRRQAARGAAQTHNGAQKLIEMARHNQLDQATQFAAAFPLHAAPWEDIRQAAAELFPTPPTKNDQPLPAMNQLLEMKGDVAAGRQVFATTSQCATCHKVNGEGKEVGPDLSGIGQKLSRQALFESIIYPSAGISHNYETHTLVLADGNVLSGIILSQSDDSVTIKGADALQRTVPREEIEEMVKQDISLMPADLQKTVTVQELVDVVEYLTTLREGSAEVESSGAQ